MQYLKAKQLDELKSSVGFATADKLNDVQANKLLTNMMKMDEFYNPPAVTNITDLATGTRDLDAQGLESLRTKVLPDEEKSALMTRLDDIVKKKQGKRMLDEDEITELDIDVGGLDAYDFDGTLASANRIRKERADYIRDMELEYRKGNLDPAPGEANRETFLRKKFDEMEASGDKKLMTRDEIEELSAFENTSPIQKTPFDEAVEYNARPEDVVQNLVDQKFGIGYFDNVGATPAQRGSAREFLVEALKKENPNQTNFSDIL